MYQEILTRAEIKLIGRHDDIVREMRLLISMGTTGGEITSMIGKYLKDLKFTNNPAFAIMEDDIAEYILSCRKQGLIIR